jgi:KDO2-lipid IV(A) lauroyltransferase
MTKLQRLVSGPRAIRLGLFFGRHIPEALGHRLSWWAAGTVCRLKPAVYHIVRSNLGPVLGAKVDRQTLEGTTRRVLHTAIRGYFDLFRALHFSAEEMSTLVDVPDATIAVARSLWNREGGAVIVFPHLGSFDLGGHAIAPYLPQMQLLTLPDPPPGFEMLNESRRRTGVTVTPLSSTALRQAIKLLRHGGVVSVAGDRPVSDLGEPFPFFGHPARLPSGHVRLALRTDAVVSIAYCTLDAETQRYAMHLEPPMEMIRTGNRGEELQLNMKRILAALERIIRRWPDQWQMLVPVWPQLLEA